VRVDAKRSVQAATFPPNWAVHALWRSHAQCEKSSDPRAGHTNQNAAAVTLQGMRLTTQHRADGRQAASGHHCTQTLPWDRRKRCRCVHVNGEPHDLGAVDDDAVDDEPVHIEATEADNDAT
jgi:hypothetical protein